MLASVFQLSRCPKGQNMNRDKLAQLLDQHPPGILCTADASGTPNAAVFGSTHLLDNGEIAIGLGDTRSLKNLRQNPQACLILHTPGTSPWDTRGVRLYLDCTALEVSGPIFSATFERIQKTVGNFAAEQIKATALFALREVRPLLDRS